MLNELKSRIGDREEKAVESIRKGLPGGEAKAAFILAFTYHAVELQLELKTSDVISDFGTVIASSARPDYQKRIELGMSRGSWPERVKKDACHITQKNMDNLIDAVLDPARLKSCNARKAKLLKLSAKVSNFIHEYVPGRWMEEGRLQASGTQVYFDFLRKDKSIYLKGKSNSIECEAGLKLLERECAGSLTVLKSVAEKHSSVVLPHESMNALQKFLDEKN